MNFHLIVTSAPYLNDIHFAALQSCASILDQGHTVSSVFFWGDGVSVANRFNVWPRNETNISEKWVELADKGNFALNVCIASAARRGIFDAKEAQRHGYDVATIHAGFTINGLGALVDSSQTADRTLRF